MQHFSRSWPHAAARDGCRIQPACSRSIRSTPLHLTSSLIALSLSTASGSTRFSVEFLDLSLASDLELTLDLDLWPDPGGGRRPGTDWDISLTASPGGQLELIQDLPATVDIELPTIKWDEALDVVEISFDRWPQLRDAPYLIMVRTRPRGTDKPADVLGPVASDAIENRKADLLLTFWNTFAANTPAEALRSWDGAHSGPAGERFGLRHLLGAAEEFSIPVALLDVNSPQNLSGLEFLGNLDYVRQLQGRGLLTLPQTLPAIVLTGSVDELNLERVASTRAAATTAFGIRPSAWLSLIQANSPQAALSALSRTGVQGLISGACLWYWSACSFHIQPAAPASTASNRYRPIPFARWRVEHRVEANAHPGRARGSARELHLAGW